MQQKQFIIDSNEYMGDFDLNITMNSGQTSQPPWVKEDNRYCELITLSEDKVLVEISQEGLNDELIVNYYSEENLDEEVRQKLFYIFDLDYDITKVYDYIKSEDKLKDIYNFNTGLRLYKAQSPFECIISSICSANNSIKRWTKSISMIRKAYGDSISVNGRKYYQFPLEDVFIKIPDTEDGLKSFGVGYRSTHMLDTTEMILSEENYYEKIKSSSYEDAFRKMLELRGVGSKVADCILLYGFNKRVAYPVDVWINRITNYMYFNGQKTGNDKIMKFGQEKFGEYAGYIQLYLFNYARLSGLTEKLKKQ